MQPRARLQRPAQMGWEKRRHPHVLFPFSNARLGRGNAPQQQQRQRTRAPHHRFLRNTPYEKRLNNTQTRLPKWCCSVGLRLLPTSPAFCTEHRACCSVHRSPRDVVDSRGTLRTCKARSSSATGQRRSPAACSFVHDGAQMIRCRQVTNKCSPIERDASSNGCDARAWWLQCRAVS